MLKKLSSEEIERVSKVHSKPLPVDVQKLCLSFGVPVFEERLPDNISGAIRRTPAFSGSGFSILVNQCHSIHRKRFSALHELSHYLLHRDSIPKNAGANEWLRTRSRGRVAELDADRLAGELLVPEKDLADLKLAIRKNRLVSEYEHIIEAAQRLNCSPHVVEIRLFGKLRHFRS